MRKLLIRDITLRDGQQSKFATRMTQAQIDRVLPDFKKANFYAMEVWGGAVPDSTMRYLSENPWTRLEKIKEAIGDTSLLTALSRGRNLFGYNPYPNSVIEGFNRNSIKSGINIMRIFDALNDVDNMKSTIEIVKANGGIADCAVCYTVDSKFTFLGKTKAILSGKKIPGKIFTIDYFVDIAQKLEKLGADMISIKDMAGLIPPQDAGALIRAFKKTVSVPINIHTHCTPGYGLASVLTAIVNGVDIVDTAIMNFAGGTAAPAFELIQLFANKLHLDTGVNLDVIAKINKDLEQSRRELGDFDTSKMFPKAFDLTKDKLPAEIDKLFDQAIDAAKNDKVEQLLKCIHEIEAWFNFPKPNETVKEAQIPGGMYTNMLAQLKQLGLEEHLEAVLKIVPQVRLDAGCPPLVTPTSQIVGVQAVNCIVDQAGGKPFYTSKSTQFTNLVKGKYGKTPFPVDPKFREKICGDPQERPFTPDEYVQPEIPELNGKPLTENEQESLLLELFPAVAVGFLKKQKQKYLDENLEKEALAEISAKEAEQIDLSRALSGNYL